MFLKDRDKQLLQKRGIDFGDEPTGGNGLVRAIVKDLALQDTGVNASSIRKIRGDICTYAG